MLLKCYTFNPYAHMVQEKVPALSVVSGNNSAYVMNMK